MGPTVGGGKDNLIIFGHGFADPYLVTALLSEKFADSFDRIVLDYFDKTVTHHIDDIALPIYKIVESVARYNYDNVFYIGHSLGGAIARRLATIDAENSYIKGYVTLASPLRGEKRISIVPKAIAPPALRDLRPNSRYMQTTNELPEEKTLELYAQIDPLVKCPKNKLKVPFTDHLTIVTAKRTFFETYAFLVYDLLNSDGRDLSRGLPGNEIILQV